MWTLNKIPCRCESSVLVLYKGLFKCSVNIIAKRHQKLMSPFPVFLAGFIGLPQTNIQNQQCNMGGVCLIDLEAPPIFHMCITVPSTCWPLSMEGNEHWTAFQILQMSGKCVEPWKCGIWNEDSKAQFYAANSMLLNATAKMLRGDNNQCHCVDRCFCGAKIWRQG